MADPVLSVAFPGFHLSGYSCRREISEYSRTATFRAPPRRRALAGRPGFTSFLNESAESALSLEPRQDVAQVRTAGLKLVDEEVQGRTPAAPAP